MFELTPQQSELVERVSVVTGANIFELIESIYNLGRDYHNKRAAVGLLENERSILRSQLMEEYRVQRAEAGERTTESQLKNLAQIDKRYIDHCKTIELAQRQAGEAGELYYAARNTREAISELNKIYKSELYNA